MTWRSDLHTMACSLGYPKWRRNESQGRLQQAVVNSLMTTYVFWGMVKEYCMSDGRIDLNLIYTLCTRVPISTIFDKVENLTNGRPCFFDHPDEISTPLMSISSEAEDDLSMS